MFNGEIRIKGDSALCKAAVPEALRLANVVRGMKEAAGLDALEKYFDIPGGGTVRVVDLAHVRLLHIYVPSVVPVAEGEEEKEEVIYAPNVYVLYPAPRYKLPVATDIPAPQKAALSQIMNAMRIQNNEFTLFPEGFLYPSEYAYEELDLITIFGGSASQFDTVTEGNAHTIYTNVSTEIPPTRTTKSYGSKYNYTPPAVGSGAAGGIFTRGYRLGGTNSFGFGVLGKKWLIKISASAPWTEFYMFYVEVYPRGSSLAPSTTGNGEPLDHFDGSYAAYPGMTAGHALETRFGSYFFNFSPDGTKAVRVRVFSISTFVNNTVSSPTPLSAYPNGTPTSTTGETIGTTTYTAFLEELAFELDDGIPLYLGRTITLATTTVITETTNINGSGVKGSNARNNTSNSDWSVVGDRILVAADYLPSGELTKLFLSLDSLERDSTVTEVWTYGPTNSRVTPAVLDFPPYHNHEGHGEDTWVYSDADLNETVSVSYSAETSLIYEARGVEHVIPFNSYDGVFSHTWSAQYDEYGHLSVDAVQYEITPVNNYPATPYRTDQTVISTTTETDSETYTLSEHSTMTGTPSFVPNLAGSLACMDLRYGIFVTSMSDVTWDKSGNHTTSKTEVEIVRQEDRWLGAIGVGSSSEATYTTVNTSGDYPTLNRDALITVDIDYRRRDKLYVFNPALTLVGEELPEVEGINTPNRPKYASSISTEYYVTATSPGYNIGGPPLLDRTHLGSFGSSAGAKVAGVSGSLAVDPGVSAVFSVLGVDYTPTSAPGSQIPLANSCKQATYAITFEDQRVHVLTPLLWDSKNLDLTSTPEANRSYCQVGIIGFVIGGERRDT
jgi:hypothetical protein